MIKSYTDKAGFEVFKNKTLVGTTETCSHCKEAFVIEGGTPIFLSEGVANGPSWHYNVSCSKCFRITMKAFVFMV